jgi:hypothetical protein
MDVVHTGEVGGGRFLAFIEHVHSCLDSPDSNPDSAQKTADSGNVGAVGHVPTLRKSRGAFASSSNTSA